MESDYVNHITWITSFYAHNDPINDKDDVDDTHFSGQKIKALGKFKLSKVNLFMSSKSAEI